MDRGKALTLRARASLWPSVTIDEKGRKRIGLQSLYSCRDMCGRRGSDAGDPTSRAAARCSLPDIDPTTWDPSTNPEAAREAEERAAEMMGLAERQGLDLDFDLDRDGCPRGWALSTFATSVSRFMGRRGPSSSMRTANDRTQWHVIHDAARPDRLLDAVEIAEAAEDGCFSLYAEICGAS